LGEGTDGRKLRACVLGRVPDIQADLAKFKEGDSTITRRFPRSPVKSRWLARVFIALH
jgi:hypothetical protein